MASPPRRSSSVDRLGGNGCMAVTSWMGTLLGPGARDRNASPGRRGSSPDRMRHEHGLDEGEVGGGLLDQLRGGQVAPASLTLILAVEGDRAVEPGGGEPLEEL